MGEEQTNQNKEAALWEKRCTHMAEVLHRILVAKKVLRPCGIGMIELLALAEDYAEHLEQPNCDAHLSILSDSTLARMASDYLKRLADLSEGTSIEVNWPHDREDMKRLAQALEKECKNHSNVAIYASHRPHDTSG